MEHNVGKTDKTIRVVVAVLIAGAGYFYGIWWLYLIAVGMFITAICGYCPPYKWLGMNTCKKLSGNSKEEIK